MLGFVKGLSLTRYKNIDYWIPKLIKGLTGMSYVYLDDICRVGGNCKPFEDLVGTLLANCVRYSLSSSLVASRLFPHPSKMLLDRDAAISSFEADINSFITGENSKPFDSWAAVFSPAFSGVIPFPIEIQNFSEKSLLKINNN